MNYRLFVLTTLLLQSLLLLSSCGEVVVVPQEPAVALNGGGPTDGKDGADGKDGVDGQNGHSMVFETVVNPSACVNGGYTLLIAVDSDDSGLLDPSDSNLQSLTICNGEDAPASPTDIAEIIDPCGPEGSYDEVLLQLANGQIIASFSANGNALNTRFAIIPDGNYSTTDGTGCNFSVSGSVVSW